MDRIRKFFKEASPRQAFGCVIVVSIAAFVLYGFVKAVMVTGILLVIGVMAGTVALFLLLWIGVGLMMS